MPNDWFPKQDGAASSAADRAVVAFEADEAAYGLTEVESARLRAKVAAFNSALVAADAAKAAQNTAVANKDAARRELEDDLRAIYRQVQERPDVTDAARQTAGLPVRDTTRSYNAPISPRDLVAQEGANGVHFLKWNANGNASGIMFAVEAKAPGDVDFKRLDAVTTVTFRTEPFARGARVEFRIRARRGTEYSEPSNVAVVGSG